MVSRIIPVDCFDLTIFGATGDLAKRKIFSLPCFTALSQDKCLKTLGSLVWQEANSLAQSFREYLRKELRNFASEAAKDQNSLDNFLCGISYITLDIQKDSDWKNLAQTLRENVIRAFYLSVSPSLFEDISSQLIAHQIADKNSRIILEKPFGEDLQSAQKLNRALAKSFHEQQIYRIDHYLGKETVQNLMALRFANILWEPLWNASYIDHVQITVAENISIEGRALYYDKAGAMKDMVQKPLDATSLLDCYGATFSLYL